MKFKEILNTIYYRCNYPTTNGYKYYGGKGIKCLITVEELEKLWFQDKAYNMKKPSISRKNHDKDYTFDNCKFIEHSINSGNANISKRKRIIQYDLNGNFIREWESIASASKFWDFDNSTISKNCLGKIKRAYNYIWKYKEVK